MAPQIASGSAASRPIVQTLPEPLQPAPQPVAEPVAQPVPQPVAAESEGYFQPVESKKCSAATRAGKPCRALPRIGRTWCIFHDPQYAPQQRANSARGGSISRPPAPLDYQSLPLAIRDRASLQAVLDNVLRLQLFGKIPLNRSSHILRTIALAERNFDPPGLIPGLGKRQVHDGDTYASVRSILDGALPQVTRALTDAESARRSQAISDAAARVYEVLKTRQLLQD